MNADILSFYGFILVLVSLIGYWIERIVIKAAEQKRYVTKELLDQILQSFQTLYDYLTEDVNE